MLFQRAKTLYVRKRQQSIKELKQVAIDERENNKKKIQKIVAIISDAIQKQIDMDMSNKPKKLTMRYIINQFRKSEILVNGKMNFSRTGISDQDFFETFFSKEDRMAIMGLTETNSDEEYNKKINEMFDESGMMKKEKTPLDEPLPTSIINTNNMDNEDQNKNARQQMKRQAMQFLRNSSKINEEAGTIEIPDSTDTQNHSFNTPYQGLAEQEQEDTINYRSTEVLEPELETKRLDQKSLFGENANRKQFQTWCVMVEKQGEINGHKIEKIEKTRLVKL